MSKSLKIFYVWQLFLISTMSFGMDTSDDSRKHQRDGSESEEPSAKKAKHVDKKKLNDELLRAIKNIDGLSQAEQAAKVKELLDAGADASEKISDDFMIHIAAQQGNPLVVELLLNYGANINSLGVMNASPLIVASEFGHIETVKLLVKRGANIKHRDEDDKNAFEIAAGTNHVDIMQFFISLPGINIKQLVNEVTDTTTPLYWAARFGSVDAVRFLLDHGADISISYQFEGITEQTPLHLAAWHNESNPLMEITNVLFRRPGFDINAKNSVGQTALMIAAFMKHEDALHLLIELGADETISMRNGETAFDEAYRSDISLVPKMHQWVQDRQHDKFNSKKLKKIDSLQRLSLNLVAIIAAYLYHKKI